MKSSASRMLHSGRLSKTFVDGVKVAGRYGDGRGGFGLSVLVKPRKAGGWSKTFSQRLRIHGKVVNIGLGPYPLVTLAEAREQAIDNARVAWRDGDPRRPENTIPTFAEVAERVIGDRAKTLTARATKDWRATLDKHALPRIGSRRIDQLDTQDVYAVLKPIWQDMRPTAKKVLQRVTAVMTFAQAQGLYRGDNPALAVTSMLPKNGYRTKHQEALPHADVADALAKVRTSNAYAGAVDALEFLVLTAARSGEVRGARWGEIDLQARTWTIPAERTKTGAEHAVPLSRMAIEALDHDRAQGYADASGFVFPASRGGMMRNGIPLSRLLWSNDIPATVHGFRSSFRDWCAENGVDRQLAESALAHVVPGVEGAYMRSDLFNRRRELMEDWGKYLTNASNKY